MSNQQENVCISKKRRRRSKREGEGNKRRQQPKRIYNKNMVRTLSINWYGIQRFGWSRMVAFILAQL
jgi:tRNA(Glu) U13 pseudouridine synthase TruD